MPKSSTNPARKTWPFFALFVLVGLAAMTPFVLQAIRDYRIAQVYLPTQCTVVDEKVVSSTSSSILGGSRVETLHSHTEFIWSYRVDGRSYMDEGYDNHDGIMTDPEEMGNISKGLSIPCWYDPADPEESVLVRHFRAKFYLGALIPGTFVVLGGIMLTAVLRRKPQSTDVRVSKGERLRVRLSPIISTRGIMGCFVLLILVLGLIIVLVLKHIQGGEFGVLLVGAGIEGFLLYHLFRAIRTARLPDPIVEINHEPLKAGQTTELYVRHPGPAKLAGLEIRLVCEKTGPKGERTVHDEVLLERKELRITAEEYFNGKFTLPPKAAPSIKTVQTVTNWCVRVRRILSAKLSYDTDYPFRVER